MNKKLIVIILAALFLFVSLPVLSGCRKTRVTVQELSETETAVPQTGTAPTAETETEPPADVPAATVSEAPALLTPEETGTAAAPSGEPSFEAKTSVTALPEAETVTLPIELPAANGTMEVSVDPQNTFIRTVSAGRGIDPALLASVYSVPPSGQNYVFEFTKADDRSVDSLRRVYLLTDDLRIKSVAATSAAERERISLTENWFCMNVLIKGVVFPSVQEKIQ